MAVSVPGNSCGSCNNTRTLNQGCLFRLPGECVYYSGSKITNFNINTGDNLNVSLNKISQYITSITPNVQILSRTMKDYPLVRDYVTGDIKYRNQIVDLTTSKNYLQTFSLQNTPLNSIWANLTWAPELKLLVATSHSSGNATGVMTSPDGITWTLRNTPQREWRAIAWSPKLQLFAALAGTGPNGVMTSSDGISWVQGVLPNSYLYRYLIWVDELGLFIGVANTIGVTDKVITSPDGINWTPRTCPDSAWNQIVWAPDKKILVASSGSVSSTQKIMTSPDGINWTGISDPVSDDGNWEAIAYSPDLGLFILGDFVQPGVGVVGQRIATSPNGTTWTRRATPAEGKWLSIAWSPQMGMFMCVGDDPSINNQVMISNDGINWSLVSPSASKAWRRVIWVRELGCFVIVAYYDGTTPPNNLVQFSRAEDDKQQYLSIYSRILPQTVQGDLRFTSNTYAGQRLIEGTNDNFFATATLRAYTEYSTSTNPTKAVNFGAFQYLFLNDGSSLSSVLNTYDSLVIRLRGAATIQDSINNIPASRASLLFTRASDFTAAPVVTGQISSQYPISAFTGIVGATGSGNIALNGWYCALHTITQLNTGTHTAQNVADIITGGNQYAGSNTITNKYALYLNSSASGVVVNAYGIYQTGTTDINYLEGKLGLGTNTPSAKIHLGAGTAAAGTAPLKLTAGVNLTTPENGTLEFDGTNLYFTVGGVRKTVTLV